MKCSKRGQHLWWCLKSYRLVCLQEGFPVSSLVMGGFIAKKHTHRVSSILINHSYFDGLYLFYPILCFDLGIFFLLLHLRYSHPFSFSARLPASYCRGFHCCALTKISSRLVRTLENATTNPAFSTRKRASSEASAVGTFRSWFNSLAQDTTDVASRGS